MFSIKFSRSQQSYLKEDNLNNSTSSLLLFWIWNLKVTYFFQILIYRPYTFQDILEDTENTNLGICTSVVISDRFVVTAAHCIEEFQA